MITGLFVIVAALVAVGSAFLLKHLERAESFGVRGPKGGFSKRQIHRITEQGGHNH